MLYYFCCKKLFILTLKVCKMSIASVKSILSSACASLGLFVVAVKKYKHFFHIYLKNDKKTLDENYELLKDQISSRFYIIIDWSRVTLRAMTSLVVKQWMEKEFTLDLVL